MLETSQTIQELSKALVQFHANLKEPKNSKTVKSGKFSYGYIELPDLVNELRPQLAAQGLMLMQAPYSHDNCLGVETMLLHSSGEFIKSKFCSNEPNGGAQAVGSQITYFRRYAILSVLGLGQDDDDGKAATGNPNVTVGNGALATVAQINLIRKLLGADEYDAHREFIEKKMTAGMADKKIKELMEKK